VKLLARSRSCCGGAWGGLLLPALAFAAPQADVRPALFLKFLPERLFKQSAAAAAALLLLLARADAEADPCASCVLG